jgi:uncharacterized protein (TIGR02145 family)
MKLKSFILISLLVLSFYIISCNKSEPSPPINYFHPCPSLATVTYEGKTYQTIQIGEQCWLRENLDVGEMITSTNTGDHHSDVSNDTKIQKYCYNNSPSNCVTYGGLYDWNEMMTYDTTNNKGICPSGFHIPRLEELDKLVNIVGGFFKAGKRLRDGDNIGFGLLFGGEREVGGDFAYITEGANCWLRNSVSDSVASCFYILSVSDTLVPNEEYKATGHHVRCIKD